VLIDLHTHFYDADRHLGPQVVADMRRCHIDPGAWRFTPEDHLRATAEADYVVVFGLAAAKVGFNIPNDAVAAHVARDPKRLILFGSPDPAQPSYMDELIHCHQDLKCKGVKLGPIYQGVHPHDKRYYDIYAYCAKHGLPIMIHMATTFSSGVPLEWARPALMDKVAVDFPDLKIVMAHIGHPWEGECIAAIRHQPNLFADLSALYYRPWQFYNSMRLLCEYRADDKLFFGSDYPATTTAGTISGLRNVNKILGQSGLPPVPTEVIEGILSRDSLSILGIKREV